MSDPVNGPDFVMNAGEKMTVLFMQMVFQLSSLATLLMGQAPHPETGETRRDLEAARTVIDQLDMLEAKTRGNLSREEEQLLKQTLMGLRMAYVEAVNQPEPAAATPEEGASKPTPPPDSAAPASPPSSETAAETEAPADESKKRFSKKY